MVDAYKTWRDDPERLARERLLQQWITVTARTQLDAVRAHILAGTNEDALSELSKAQETLNALFGSLLRHDDQIRSAQSG
jgi:hypothetical protein